MGTLFPLALTSASAHATASKAAGLFEVGAPNHWPAQGDLITWCQTMGPGLAALLILIGVVYLMFGFNIFKGLVMVNAALLGLAVGLAVGEKLGAKWPMAIVGAVLVGAISWPTMKYAVALMGGVCGALAGLTIWQMVGLDAGYAWSGAAIGLIAFGLLCFILFRGCVMMYTSLQGSVMLICGILGLVLKYPEVAPKIGSYLASRQFLLPMCVFIATVIGMMYQQSGGGGAPKPAGGGKK